MLADTPVWSRWPTARRPLPPFRSRKEPSHPLNNLLSWTQILTTEGNILPPANTDSQTCLRLVILQTFPLHSRTSLNPCYGCNSHEPNMWCEQSATVSDNGAHNFNRPSIISSSRTKKMIFVLHRAALLNPGSDKCRTATNIVDTP